MTAHDIATALARVSSGDQSPPRPWAYLSHIGITDVSDVSALTIEGYVDAAGFQIICNGKLYTVNVREGH